MPAQDGPNPRDAPGAFEQLGQITLAEQTMESVLQLVCQLITEVMPGDIAASVSVLAGDRPETPVFAGQLAVDLDERQYSHGDGPCLTAATSREIVAIDDTRTDLRWREYLMEAARHGCLSSLSVPLPLDDTLRGALNIYARRPAAFGADERERGSRFAGYAAVAVANMQAYQEAVRRGQHLQTALESRAVIDQAKGILMERYKLSADRAFQMMATLSMESNVKVRVIAERVVLTGEVGTSRSGR
ncbi:ANTAR domain-containing protein [Modestobacter lapidis]|nr:GAF and ANTAR domain-containing protein [Modestobacter lapidis]